MKDRQGLAIEFQQLCDDYMERQEYLIKKYKLTHEEEITALLTTHSLLISTTFKDDTQQALKDIKGVVDKSIKESGSITAHLKKLGGKQWTKIRQK